MKSPVDECRHNQPGRIERRANIRPRLQQPSIMQTKNSAVTGAAQQSGYYPIGGQFPVYANRSPHHAQEVELALDCSQSEPADPVRRAKKARSDAGGFFDGRLRASQFPPHHGGRSQAKIRMSIGMIADLVTRGQHLSRDAWQAAYVGAALKERGRNLQPIQDLE